MPFFAEWHKWVSIPCHTLVSMPLSSSSLHTLSGQVSDVGQNMFAVSALQDASQYCHIAINLCQPWHWLWQHPHQSCWTPPTFQRIHLSAHLHRLFHPLAWSHPFPDITAENVAGTSIFGWIACFDTPSMMSTHRGRQFESELFTHLMQLLGTKPITNGLVERLRRQSAQGFSESINWPNLLDCLYPWCYLAFVLSSRKTSTAPPQSSCYGTYHTPPAWSVLQCIFLRHWLYFIHTASQIYHAAASCSICLSSSSHCSHSRQPHHMHTCVFQLWCYQQAPTTTLWWPILGT